MTDIIREITTVQEDDDGNAFIVLPQSILEYLDLKPGDVLEWEENGDGCFLLKKKETEWVLVDTVSTFRMRYLIQVPKNKSDWALDTVTMNDAVEFSQKFLDETVVSHRVISREDAIRLCREDNNNNSWTDDKIVKTYFTTLGDVND